MNVASVSLNGRPLFASRANFLEEGVQRLGSSPRRHRGDAVALANAHDAVECPDGGEGRALKRSGKDDDLFPVLEVRSARHGEPNIPARPTDDGNRDAGSWSALQRLQDGNVVERVDHAADPGGGSARDQPMNGEIRASSELCDVEIGRAHV